MDITINRPINPNFQALHLSSYRKCHREIGDFHRSDYKLIKDSLSEYAKDVEIYVSPSQNSVSSGFDVEIKKLGEKRFWDQGDSIKFNVQRRNAKLGLVADTIVNTQRVVKEYINNDFCGALYVPDKGEYPEVVDAAIPRLKELAKGVNIFVYPLNCQYWELPCPRYKIYVQKPGLDSFDVEKQPKKFNTKYSNTFVYPNSYDPLHSEYVAPLGDWTTESMVDEIVNAASSICKKIS